MADFTLPILMYHGIHANAQSRGRFDPFYSVTPNEYSAQLDWLKAQGYRTVRLDDLASDASARTTKDVIISFDDGDVSNVEVALPLLRARGMVAEFFVTSDFVDTPGMLTSTDLRVLAGAGMGVQSHGLTHRFLEDLPEGELDVELDQSKHLLESIIGIHVEALALPGGRGGDREFTRAKQLGYRFLLNSAPGVNSHWRADRYLQRLAITRGIDMDTFASLIRWRGLTPRVAAFRYNALALPKRWLGNRRYESLRSRVLGQ